MLLALACGPRHTATPDDLRDAWAKALRDDDPEKAWALLSPGAQAQIGKEAFLERWTRDREDHRAQLEAHEKFDPAADEGVVLAGRTTHPGGAELRWVEVEGDYLVLAGLPTSAWTMTAESTIRAFISALRRASDGSLEGLVAPELRERVSDAWSERADAIEAALEVPGSLELSSEYDRAVLRYEGGAVVLERTESGWRVFDLR